ncbi:YdeI/OmpD-associated family protein [Nocardia aurea]|uniref:YdeI/OmpD-associated family protein n=1 Tax=Nocardia aurea TaxID=2144174 RepID=UPI001E390649|nr:YdeI/OmpD-associated family protein [Nocardia aurea]
MIDSNHHFEPPGAPMESRDTADTLDFATPAAWESWLTDNHASSTGVWLKIAKKNSGSTTITITEALDGALCYGWIDSNRRSLDSSHYLQRYSPRRPKSPWSQVNVTKAETLIAAGRMRSPGFAAIAAAESDGRWSSAYAPQRTATTPPDLAAALSENPTARTRFANLDRTARYSLFLRLMKATPTTRPTQLTRIMAQLSD